MPALAITDFTNLCGPGEVLRNGARRGMKPIVGADFHVQSDLIGDELTQISVLAMNNTGYQNLTLLISKAYQRGYGALGPWIDRDWLAELNEGLLLISGGRMGTSANPCCAVTARWWSNASRSMKNISRIVITRS